MNYKSWGLRFWETTLLEISPQTLAHHPNLIQYVGQLLIAGLRSIEALGHEMILYREAPLTQAVVAEGQQQEGQSQLSSASRSILIARIPSTRAAHDAKHLRLSVDSSKLYLFTAQREAITSQLNHRVCNLAPQCAVG
jgi:hypothetical protein